MATDKQDLPSRRQFQAALAGALSAATFARLRADDASADEQESRYRLRYALASSLFGTLPLSEIFAEAKRLGIGAIDIWPRVHGSQREQIDATGEDTFHALLAKHDAHLAVLTRYDLGPFGLAEELDFAKRFKCPVIVTGSRGPRDLAGDELKSAIGEFVEEMRPHVAHAEKHGVTLAIENHGGQLLAKPDGVRWFADALRSEPTGHLGLALAPYHLPQDAKLLAELIEQLGSRLKLFYAWQYGKGCTGKLPKEEELLQMPGRGELDFRPLLAALAKIGFDGFTEPFMHPVPRGIPILETAREVGDEVRRAMRYLDERVA